MLFYYFYALLLYLLNPFTSLFVEIRLYRNKENKSKYLERLGYFTNQRPYGKLAWFHVASVGEFNSVLPIIKHLEKNYIILVTGITQNVHKVISEIKFKNTIFQFAPLDTPQIVNRFLKHWNPDIGIFVDSELWPNLINLSSKKFKLINLNAKLSDKSFKRWNYAKSFVKFLYNKFTIILPCSMSDYNKIANFVKPEKLKFIGNLKFCTYLKKVGQNKLSKYIELLKGKDVILASSTHNNEEEIILKIFKNIKIDYPNIFLIIVPRHPERINEITQMCDLINLNYNVRSQKHELDINKNLYIADTLNELNLWYSISNIAIIGGSFVDIGGHNLLEAARLNNAVVIGNYYNNFKDIVTDFNNNRALIISSKENLHDDLSKLLMNKSHISTLASNASQLSNDNDSVKLAQYIIESLIFTQQH